MKSWIFGSALVLATLGCGGTTQSREDDSGNTNWLKSCETDVECGNLTCLCGSCRTECAATTDCSLPPAGSCVGLPAEGSPDPAVPAPATQRELRDPDALPKDLTVGDDGSVTLAGGRNAVPFDLTTVFTNFWVTKLSAEGEPLWVYEEPMDTPNSARSVVLTGSETIALSTVYNGTDTPNLRRLDDNGELLASFTSSPGFTTMREDGNGGFFAAGSNWAEDFPNALGRNPTVAWVGLFNRSTGSVAEPPLWEQERYGLEGGISNLVVASSDRRGSLVVGGSLGTAADSNASQPYLARLFHPGNFRWELSVPIPEVTHCDATAVAMLPDGSSLGAIGCGPRWLRAFGQNGDVLWERRFANGVTALAGLEDGGYAVALGGGSAVVDRYDAQHRLLWSAVQEGCTAFTRLAVTDDTVLALAECEPGYVLSWYRDP